MNSSIEKLKKSSKSTTNENSHVEKYLAFNLGGEYYLVATRYTIEIVNSYIITPIPQTNDHLAGVFNLKGKIVPAIDLGVALQVESTKKGRCIIVVNYKPEGEENMIVGLLVDGVRGVLSVNEENIKRTPSTIEKIASSYSQGILRDNNILYTVLNIKELVEYETINIKTEC